MTMRAKQLLQNANCSTCTAPIGRSGIPLFWTVTIERHGLDLDAIRRHDGLAMMMGSHALAEILGPNEDLTIRVMEPIRLTICESCMMEKFPLLAELALREESNDQQDT